MKMSYTIDELEELWGQFHKERHFQADTNYGHMIPCDEGCSGLEFIKWLYGREQERCERLEDSNR